MEVEQLDPALQAQDVEMNEPPTQQDTTMVDDLFDDVDEEPAADGSQVASESEQLPPEEAERRRALEYAEDDIPPEVAVEVREAEVAFPNLPVPKSSDGDNWVVRLPSYIAVDSKPFHQDTYVGPEEEETLRNSAREQSMTVKLKVENTLRWRWGKDKAGNDVKQSNSRVIRWSDGSLSLRLGKELYDISQNIDQSGGISRQSFGNTQTGPKVPVAHAPGGRSQGLTYLVAQHKRSQVLQAEAVITGTMTLRPTSMNSEAHQMLVRSVGQKHQKLARLRMTAEPTHDPEKELQELKKASDKRDRKRERELNGPRPRAPRKRSRREEQYYSDDEELGEEAEAYGYSDEDGEGSKRSKGSKKVGEGEYADDGFVVEDSDDDDEWGGRKRKTRRKNVEEEEDDLDRMERQIENQSRKKRSHPEDEEAQSAEESDEKGASSQGDNAMDIESEDDEDEFKVRKAGGGRRALAVDDEEEE